MRFAAISVLRFISDFYLESTNKQGGSFQNILHDGNGLHHVITVEVFQCQLTIGFPHGFARVSHYPFPCNGILFGLKRPYQICAYLTVCLNLGLSPLTDIQALDETLLNDEKLAIWLRCNTTKYSDNSAYRTMGQQFWRSTTRSSRCAGMALLHNVRGASSTMAVAMALLEEVAKLNTLVPDVWLIPFVGEGQRPAVPRAL